MLDIDRFKRVNDCHGHAVGDDVLREIAQILQGQCRDVDLLCRHGGEEFALALPQTSLPEAVASCERIRMAIARHDWTRIAPALNLTVSVGVAQYRPGETAEALIARADARLYAAKRNGRDRVESGASALKGSPRRLPP